MSRYFVAEPRTGEAREIDFSDFIALIKSTSIVSLGASDTFLELGLSEGLMLRLETGGNGVLNAVIISTLNPDDVVPQRLQLVGAEEEPSAALVEQRLRSLRQLYAATYLLDAGRQDELAEAVRENPQVDIEESLLTEEERLYLQAAGPGSWYVTALTKIKGAGEKALYGLGIAFGEGRQLLLQRLRTGNQIQAEELRKRQIENVRLGVQTAIDLTRQLDKIKDVESREAVRELLISNTASIRPEVGNLLPAPEKKKAIRKKK